MGVAGRHCPNNVRHPGRRMRACPRPGEMSSARRSDAKLDLMSKPHKPSIRLTSITLGAPAPRELAQFYANLLDAAVTASDPPRPGEPEDAGGLK